MPRVVLNAKRYRINDLENYIRGEMRRRKITQSEMASKTGMSQQSFSNHLAKMDFGVSELMEIFKELETDAEQIGRLMKV